MSNNKKYDFADPSVKGKRQLDSHCVGCQRSWMPCPAIKIPSGKVTIPNPGVPVWGIEYKQYCVKCAKAMLSKWSPLAWLRRKKYGLSFITEERLYV